MDFLHTLKLLVLCNDWLKTIHWDLIQTMHFSLEQHVPNPSWSNENVLEATALVSKSAAVPSSISRKRLNQKGPSMFKICKSEVDFPWHLSSFHRHVFHALPKSLLETWAAQLPQKGLKMCKYLDPESC